jgi:2-phosphosulfolactate phosphatase
MIACGERWPDGSLRPALEDWIGAGAVIEHLPGSRSPEAQAAFEAYRHAKDNLLAVLSDCSSGRELIESGFAGDVELAAQLSVSETVPILLGESFTPWIADRARGSLG